MSEFQEFSQTGTTETPRWVGLAVGILGGLSIVGLGLSWSALNQAKSLAQTAVASKQASDALTQLLAKEDEINQQMQSDLKVIADKLNVTQGELVSAHKQTKHATHAVDQKVDNLATSMKAELATKASADDLTKSPLTPLTSPKNSIQMARSEMGTL